MAKQLGIAIIWEADSRRQLRSMIEAAVSTTGSSEQWKVLPDMTSVFADENGNNLLCVDPPCKEWGVDKVGLLFLHLNNDNQNGFHFYLEKGRNIPAILFSSDVVNVEYFREQLGEVGFKALSGQLAFVSYMEENLNNIPFWFAIWKNQHSFKPDALKDTETALNEGDRAEIAKLAQQFDVILQRFHALDNLLQGYLFVRGESRKKPEGIEHNGNNFQHGIFQNKQALTEAFLQTSINRLGRPKGASESDGFFWFDSVAEEVCGSSPFTSENDEAIEKVLKYARFGEPELSMLVSSSSGALRTVWSILSAVYGEDASVALGFSGMKDDDVCSLFCQAHIDYVTACERIKRYLCET